MTPDDRSESEDKETTKTEYKLITDEKFQRTTKVLCSPNGFRMELTEKGKYNNQMDYIGQLQWTMCSAIKEFL